MHLLLGILALHSLLLQQPTPPPKNTRTPAAVMDASGWSWLVRPERDVEERPEEVLDALQLKDGDVVADIGAGVGYFSLRIAKRVGATGKVLAVDIQQEMLDRLVKYRDQAKLTNVEPILGTETDPKLPAASVDLALMVDVYHEFSKPIEMMEKIRASLNPKGRLVLVEYRGEDPNVPIKPLHKMTEAQVKQEIVPMGFRHVKTFEFLPWQHIIIFEKQSH